MASSSQKDWDKEINLIKKETINKFTIFNLAIYKNYLRRTPLFWFLWVIELVTLTNWAFL